MEEASQHRGNSRTSNYTNTEGFPFILTPNLIGYAANISVLRQIKRRNNNRKDRAT